MQVNQKLHKLHNIWAMKTYSISGLAGLTSRSSGARKTLLKVEQETQVFKIQTLHKQEEFIQD